MAYGPSKTRPGEFGCVLKSRLYVVAPCIDMPRAKAVADRISVRFISNSSLDTFSVSVGGELLQGLVLRVYQVNGTGYHKYQYCNWLLDSSLLRWVKNQLNRGTCGNSQFESRIR